MSDSQAPLILVDGSGWLYRAYHALPPLTAPDGTPTGAVYGMGSMLRKLLAGHRPERIAVVFDAPGRNFRHELLPEYKANRPPTPPELSDQFPLIVELVQAMGLPVLQVDGVEADDVIATLTRQARERGLPVLIVTGDKDLAQLVDDQVRLLDTMKDRVMDAAAVEDKFGVPPSLVPDWLALVGDSSDNIPGVHGVGPKTAAKWLREYGSLEGLIEHAGEIRGKAGERLRQALDQLPLSRQLTTVRDDVELPLGIDELVPGPGDPEAFTALCRRLDFRRWLDEAPVAAGNTQLDTRTTTVLDEQALESLVEALSSAELICVDTETDALDALGAGLVGISFAVAPGAAWYVPIGHDYDGAPAQLPKHRVLDALRGVLEDSARPKLGHHIKYDLNVLHRHGVALAGVAHDTMLESYVLDPTGSRHDLDTLARRFLQHSTTRFSDVAGKGREQKTFNQIPLDAAAPYAAEDADITLRLHRVLHPRLAAEGRLEEVYRRIEMPLVPVLASMERHGVKVDAEALRRLSAELAERQEEVQRKAWEAAGCEFNLGSPAQLAEVLHERLGLPVTRRTPKGQPSTAEDVLAELASQHPLPGLVLEYRSLAKLRSTYAEALVAQIRPDTGRIHTSYHQAVTATGRLSSSDPNLQNIPVRSEEGRRIRRAFIAEPGCALLSLDYSQIELRLMAHISGDPGLQQAFREHRDIHRATAAEIFGVAEDAVDEQQRRAAKAINFGLIYGMSAFGLARNLGLGREQAQAWIDRFFERYPKVREYMERTRQTAHDQGYVETLFGRRLYLRDIASRNPNQRQYAERAAINAPLQGSAADLIKLAMIDLHRFIGERDAPLRMILQVHDELVFEGPREQLEALGGQIARRMAQIHRLDVPLVVDWGIGENWDAAHAGGNSTSS